MTSPHKIDFHQRAVPRPTERIGKRSPRRTITRRAAALVQISVSFKIAEATVISGTKNTNAWRISTIANSARNRPSQVAMRSEEHTSELQSLAYLVCRLLLEKKKEENGQPWRRWSVLT